ncbi:MAG TPA: cysteine--tRNA ligase [Mycobacteriales bacterium]|nr:cysteine--tRNA ligase [Mycobacteriales bacterium]
MTLRLHDTLSRSTKALEPVTPGAVGIYVCGPTVQSPPHVGHMRSAIAFDILRRWLAATGYDVTFLRNVTDIDDKILHNAGHEDIPWWALATRNTRAFTEAYDALNVLPPTGEPRATGHVPEMVALMQRLIDAGHAYAAGGDVYFDVTSFPSYGALSGQKAEAMLSAEDPGAKHDPLDFALWKGAKPGEPAWDTPWGPGRPGWHLECSAMATRYLGAEFDIHGGGLDLVFPHHENEIAQSNAAGDPFARIWLHNGMVNTGGEKMSKSLGNSLVVADVLQRARPQAVRYFLGSAHYRSDLDWSEEALVEADATYTRITGFLDRAKDALGSRLAESCQGQGRQVPRDRPDKSQVPEMFADAMNDDLAVPRALGVLHDTVRAGNTALAGGDDAAVSTAYGAVAAMLDVLGLSPRDFATSGAADDRLRGVVDALVPAMLAARQAARERKDYAEADRVRDALTAAGIVVEDTPAGPRWRVG